MKEVEHGIASEERTRWWCYCCQNDKEDENRKNESLTAILLSKISSQFVPKIHSDTWKNQSQSLPVREGVSES